MVNAALIDLVEVVSPEVGSIWEMWPLTEDRHTVVVTEVFWDGLKCHIGARVFTDLSFAPKTQWWPLRLWIEVGILLRGADPA